MLHNYKKASDHEVEQWLLKELPELTQYQKNEIHNRETVRFSPFYFMKPRKVNKRPLMRLTIAFMPIVWVALVIGLVFKWIFTGSWGYSNKAIAWYDKWRKTAGL